MSANTPAFDLSLLDGFTEPATCQYALQRPWRLPDGRGAATDGRILIVLNDGSELAPPDGRVPDVDKVLAGYGEGAEWVDAPAVKGPPAGADPWWNTGEVCSLCVGSGVCECNCCGDEHDCPRCDGEGGSGQCWSREKVKFNGVPYDRRYLWLVGQLPGAQVHYRGGESLYLDFCFRGGVGVLCGCKDSDQ